METGRAVGVGTGIIATEGDAAHVERAAEAHATKRRHDRVRHPTVVVAINAIRQPGDAEQGKARNHIAGEGRRARLTRQIHRRGDTRRAFLGERESSEGDPSGHASGSALMDLHRQHVVAAQQIAQRKQQRRAESCVAHGRPRRGRMEHRTLRHVAARDFDAVEVNHRAIIHDGAQAQREIAGRPAEVEMGAEVIRAAPRRQRRVLRRGERAGAGVEQPIALRPRRVVILGHAPHRAGVHAGVEVAPRRGDGNEHRVRDRRRHRVRRTMVVMDFVDDDLVVQLEDVRGARSRRRRGEPDAVTVGMTSAHSRLHPHGIEEIRLRGTEEKQAIPIARAEAELRLRQRQ